LARIVIDRRTARTVFSRSRLRKSTGETGAIFACRSCRHQPFWACRCFRSELRRMIRALATRTASVLGDGFFFGNGVFVSVAAVGIISDWVGAIEPCATGCMVMGPGEVGLRFGIRDNAQVSGSFGAGKRPAGDYAARASKDASSS
jgi:hypothetical protein